jgi:PAS domain S-box-containing protein
MWEVRSQSALNVGNTNVPLDMVGYDSAIADPSSDFLSKDDNYKSGIKPSLHASAIAGHSTLFEYIESADIPICLITSRGGILMMNLAFELLITKAKGEVMGRFIGEVIQPVSIENFSKLFEFDSSNHHKPVKFEATCITNHGDVRWLEVVATYLNDNQLVLLVFDEITNRIRFINDLEFQVEKFKTAFETSPYAISITRLSDGVFVEVNENFLLNTGYRLDEVIGKTSLELDFWVDPQQRGVLVKKMLEQERLDNEEVCFKMKDQGIAQALISMRIITIHKQAHLLLFARDIRLSKELENQYRLLFENLISGFALHKIICDAQGNAIDYQFLAVNPAFERLTGLNAKDIVGRNVLEVIPFVEPYWIETYGQVAMTGQTQRFVNHSIVMGKVFRVMAFSPKHLFFATIFDDITEKVQQEEELHERDEQLNQMFEHTHSVLMLITEKGELVRLNRAGFTLAEDLIVDYKGLRPGDLMKCIGSIQNSKGCGFGDVCRHCRLRYMVREAFVKGTEFEREEIWVSRVANGSINRLYLLVSMARLQLKSGVHVLVSIDDITSRKLIEDDLVTAKQRAEESDRLKTAFFSNLSHEIRTPLNGIIGFSNLLKKKDISSSDLLLYTHYINENSNRLLLIMNNVIELSQLNSRLMKIVRSELDIDKAIADAFKICKNMHPDKQLNLRVKVIGENRIITYPTVFSSSVKQLLLNAYKFTLFGSIGVKCSISRQILSCTIADTGIGIEPSFHELVFQPFRQQEDGMTRNYGGVGIGLAIVKEYMQMIGGTIVFKSIPGRGSVFRIEMPVFTSEVSDISDRDDYVG